MAEDRDTDRTTVCAYDTLGIGVGATAVEVRRAYRRMSRKYHPDKAGEDKSAQYAAVQRAYMQLGHGRRRVRHPIVVSPVAARSTPPRLLPPPP